jgi:hypothetical protein
LGYYRGEVQINYQDVDSHLIWHMYISLQT